MSIAENWWYVTTVSRRKVENDEEFQRLISDITAGKIRDVYIESQDRFGTKDTKELFSILKQFQDNNSKLIDLTDDRDLTSNDFVDEINAIIQSQQSQEELKKISRRAMRTKVNNFKATGSWPSGTQPYGYGKACKDPDKNLLWVFQPTQSRRKGQVFYADGKGKLTPGPKDTKIPAKTNKDLIYLIPHNDKSIVETVKRIFRLFAVEGLSRRQIAIRLNDSGKLYYGKPFSHSLIGTILKNPAYIGETHYGKSQTGELCSFDQTGNILSLQGADKKTKQAAQGILIKKGTHKALIGQKAWELTRARLDREKQQYQEGTKRFSPRNPKYYLKGILHCGHCQKAMTGRSDKGKIKYQCSTYSTARSNGQKSKCGFYTISHDYAEMIISEKLRESNIQYGKLTGSKEKKSIEKMILDVDNALEVDGEEFYSNVELGVTAFLSYLKDNYKLTATQISKLEKPARRLFRYGKIHWPRDKSKLPLTLDEIKNAVKEMEDAAIANANRKLEAAKKEFERLTVSWAKASDRQQLILEPEIDKLNSEIEEWERRSVPITKRIRQYWAASDDKADERKVLLAEWNGVDNRVKGEALRRIIEKVEFYWMPEWHEAEANPSRKRKTNRSGRNRYVLQAEKVSFAFKGLDMAGSS